MKKIISIAIVLIVLTAVTMAQTSSISNASEELSDPGLKKGLSADVATRLKAEKNFLNSNKQVTNIQWYDDPGGFFVYYTKDGNKGWSFYNRKGKFICNMLCYGEESLPREVREQVKSAYYLDYKITSANEINVARNGGKKVFLVMITNNKEWKRLRICEGEMQVITEFEAK